MSILPPVALTIDLELVAKAPPSALVERLSCKSPPASPGKAGEWPNRTQNAHSRRHL